MRYESLALEQLPTWAKFNGVKLDDTKISSKITGNDGSEKGGGLLAQHDLSASNPLLTVPADLILSREGIEQYAKSDLRFRELLDATKALTHVGFCISII
jgi:hypothetical protein